MCSNNNNSSVNAKLHECKIPGCVVCVGDHEKIKYIKSYGYAHLIPEKIKMHKESIFDIESVTKVFIGATSLALCLDQKIVDIDKPVSYYLPKFTASGFKNILLRHLVTHSSGIKWERVLKAGEHGDFFSKIYDTELNAPVGTVYQYSNRNAIIAGMIVEKVSGMILDDFCRENIFKPLDLKNTFFTEVKPGKLVAANRSGITGKSGNEDVNNAGRGIATAGIWTTAEDLSIIARLWLNKGYINNKHIFSENVWNISVNNLSPLSATPMGLFWFLHPTLATPGIRSNKSFGHDGFSGQTIWIDPELDYFSIVMSNRNHPEKYEKLSDTGRNQYIARSEIADIFLQSIMKLA